MRDRTRNNEKRLFSSITVVAVAPAIAKPTQSRQSDRAGTIHIIKVRTAITGKVNVPVVTVSLNEYLSIPYDLLSACARL